jgi:hypothetical protein
MYLRSERLEAGLKEALARRQGVAKVDGQTAGSEWARRRCGKVSPHLDFQFTQLS